MNVSPFLGLALWTYATGAQELVFAQAVTSVAVVSYFLRSRRGHSLIPVTIAPILGAIGLVIGYILIDTDFEVVTGLDGPINVWLLLPTPVLIVRARHPQYYDRLNQRAPTREPEPIRG